MEALFEAIKNNDIKKVKELLNQEDIVNVANENGITPLIASVRNGCAAIITTLLDLGADINAKIDDGWTALMLAVHNPFDTQAVTILLDRGADIHAKDKCGRTALMLAADNIYIETVTTLLDLGADINAKDKYGRTPLILADRVIAMALIKRGANLPDDRSNLISTMKRFYWWTDLHTAVISNNLNEISTLTYIPSEISPLDLAIMIGNKGAVRAFIDSGIEYDKDTCLKAAVYSNRDELVQIFLEKGASPFNKDRLEQTVFHCAAAGGNATILRLLQSHIDAVHSTILNRGLGLWSKVREGSGTQEMTSNTLLDQHKSAKCHRV